VRHVTDRTGVDVQEVRVLVRSIRAADAAAPVASDSSSDVDET